MLYYNTPQDESPTRLPVTARGMSMTRYGGFMTNLLGDLLTALLRAPDYSAPPAEPPKRPSTWRVMSAADLPREGRHFGCDDSCGCAPAAGLRYRSKDDNEA